MAQARVAGAGDIDAICDFLHREMSAEIPVESWRRLMTYEWLSVKPDFGSVIDDAGRIVGYLGVIYAERRCNGRSFTTGNLTSWYVARPYRQGGAAMDLLRISTRRRNVAYTSFTSTAKALPLLRLAGLRSLDDARYVWCRGAGPGTGPLKVVAGAEKIAPLLDSSQQRLVADHAALPVRPYVLSAGADECLVMLSVHEKAGGPARYDALYVGNPDVFTANAQGFADAVLPAGPAELSVDSRFLDEGAAGGAPQAIRVPRYYRPIPDLEPRDIDILYSEIQLLDLTLW